MRGLRVSAAAAALLASAVVVASSSASSKEVPVNVGTSAKVFVPAKGMTVGVFMNSLTNAYQNQVVDGIQTQAKRAGYSVKVFDSNFDPSTQLNQIQTAIQQKSVNAALILPDDSELICNEATKVLPKAGIPSIALAIPFCGHETSTGPGSWVPGSLSYSGGNNTIGNVKAFLDDAAKEIPGKQTVLLVEGPALEGQAKTLNALFPSFKKAHPAFNIKYIINTDYTTPDTLTKTEAELKAHPDITAVLSVYSPDMTRGVIDALTALGLNKKIKVGDAGGSKYSYQELRAGNLVFTIPYFPFTQGEHAVQALQTAASGKTPARFIDEAVVGTNTNPLVITKKNLSAWTPTY